MGNFAAYAFAPAILLTPLGALSVLVCALLGPYFLEETLGRLGMLGIATCLGTTLIILHAPSNEDIQTIDRTVHDVSQPGMFSKFV